MTLNLLHALTLTITSSVLLVIIIVVSYYFGKYCYRAHLMKTCKFADFSVNLQLMWRDNKITENTQDR